MAKRCQSCGMPMARDPAGGGTEADGSRSGRYCSLCYTGGALLHPDFTAAEMQAHCVDRLAEKGVPRFLGRFLMRDLPRLERWRR
jgi:hypothetical protein